MSAPNRVAGLGLCIVSAVLCAQPAAHAQSYMVTDLGTLDGVRSSARAINEAGNVVGFSGLPPNDFIIHAFVWEEGAMTDLGTLGGLDSFADGINNAGQVVGRSSVGGGFNHAFLWEDGQMIDLGTPVNVSSEANAINDAGQIVGSINLIAFIWEDGVLTELGTLPGFSASVANGINSVGDIVGGAFSICFCPASALKWTGGELIELGVLPGFDSSGAFAINDQDQVVGASSTIIPSVPHATLWDNDEIFDLGIGEGTRSFAYDINNAGVIVGYWGMGDQFLDHYATKWVDGELIDLNDLIPPDSGWQLAEARSINEAGQIAGFGFIPDHVLRGFLLTPCAPADFDCDGAVAPLDLATLLGSWGACDDCENCPADLNGDCEVGAFDLAQLLASWGGFP